MAAWKKALSCVFKYTTITTTTTNSAATTTTTTTTNTTTTTTTKAVISVAPYLTDKGEQTALSKYASV